MRTNVWLAMRTFAKMSKLMSVVYPPRFALFTGDFTSELYHTGRAHFVRCFYAWLRLAALPAVLGCCHGSILSLFFEAKCRRKSLDRSTVELSGETFGRISQLDFAARSCCCYDFFQNRTSPGDTLNRSDCLVVVKICDSSHEWSAPGYRPVDLPSGPGRRNRNKAPPKWIFVTCFGRMYNDELLLITNEPIICLMNNDGY